MVFRRSRAFCHRLHEPLEAPAKFWSEPVQEQNLINGTFLSNKARQRCHPWFGGKNAAEPEGAAFQPPSRRMTRYIPRHGSYFDEPQPEFATAAVRLSRETPRPVQGFGSCGCRATPPASR